MAETEAQQAQGEFEKPRDAGTGAPGLYKLWMRALTLAEKDEKDWRKSADETVERWRDEKQARTARYQILHANISTMVPALYNSTPQPDVRRRFLDKDPVGKIAAQVLQRSLSYSMDEYDFDDVISSAAHDSELTGRGVTRVRYVPTMEGDDVLYEEATCEHVDWRDFRHGPGRRWSEIPWVAFAHKLTRQMLVQKLGPIGNKIKLDWTQEGADKDDGPQNVPDVFKRALVWEIWDKPNRRVLFIAPSWKDGPVKVEQDPLGLRGFFPIPRPLYAIKDPNSLVP